jgi:hypothetical protein
MIGSALTWLGLSIFSSVTANVAVTGRMLFEESPPAEAVFLYFLSILLSFLALLSITGAIGLWLLTLWGRNLVAWLQLSSAIMGIVMLALSGVRDIARSGLSGILAISGLLTIFISVAIVFYLLNPNLTLRPKFGLGRNRQIQGKRGASDETKTGDETD